SSDVCSSDLGGNKEKSADFRLVSATNRKIADLLASDDFRSDLLYRINVVNIHIPPLRERPDDIESLFFYYLYSLSEKYGTSVKYRSEEHTSELQSRFDLVCRLLLEKRKPISTRERAH